MNNKAFTLVELVAIVLILGVVLLVSFPALLNINKADEDKKVQQMIDDLCTAGKTYIYSNQESFPQLKTPGSRIDINIKELIVYGNVSKDLKNPSTNISVQDDTLTYTVSTDNLLECNYIDN